MMKELISNSPLPNSEKHMANHSARKTFVKNWKNSITGPNRKAGLDAYHSGDKVPFYWQPSADCIQKVPLPSWIRLLS